MAEKVKVRLSLRPDEDWEVDADEVPGLRAQGLLMEDAAPAKTQAAAKPTADKQGA